MNIITKAILNGLLLALFAMLPFISVAQTSYTVTPTPTAAVSPMPSVSPTPIISPTPASTTTQSILQSIIQRIQELRMRIFDLQNRRNSLGVEQNFLQREQNQQVAQLIRALRQGSEGDEVLVLQTLLAADLDIYPEALITGHFGPRTEAAVRRFQRKYGIENVGVVGPKTLRKLNELLKENPLVIVLQNNVSTSTAEVTRLCVPPGHLVAPGWLKKKNGKALILECSNLPPGILQLLQSTTTPTVSSDTVPPVILGLAVFGVAGTSADIYWTTTELANAKIYYGNTTPLNVVSASTTTPALSFSASTLSFTHMFHLSGLSAGTTYYFIAESSDAAGNTSTSTERHFTTTP